MTDDTNVNAGSETSGESTDTVQTEQADTTDTVQTETAAQDAGSAVEQKAGYACTCPDGRAGTLHDQDGTLVCLPNQG